MTGTSWPAPVAPAPIRATVTVPGSKSETNRALVLAALADGPSTLTGGLDARDTRLMRDALRALGVLIDETAEGWRVTPPADGFTGGGSIDCGLAGTVMRFVPPLAGLAGGPVHFDGDPAARARPMAPLLRAMVDLGASVDGDDALPFTVSGALRGGRVEIDASTSSQYVSALLLVGARLPDGLHLVHTGDLLPSAPHIAMTVEMLRSRGVRVDDEEFGRWIVTPGPIAAQDVRVEPDLSNAAPFLAAGAITGGSVTVTGWPADSLQPGTQLREIFTRFGAEVRWDEHGLTVHGTDELHDVDLDLSDAAELSPVVAAIAALAEHTSHLRGIGHIRGHETDRLTALEAELTGLGAGVHQTHDGLTIHSKLLHDNVWHTYADHRMAHAGALLGLVVEGIQLDDIGCTDKTMPEFEALWQQMITDSVAASEARG